MVGNFLHNDIWKLESSHAVIKLEISDAIIQSVLYHLQNQIIWIPARHEKAHDGNGNSSVHWDAVKDHSPFELADVVQSYSIAKTWHAFLRALNDRPKDCGKG